MIYLSGVVNDRVVAAASELGGRLGMLAQPDGHGHLIDQFEVWAADNGCYAAGDTFDLDRWLRWLASRPNQRRCLFAAAPDVLEDAAATWTRSAPIFPMIRALGYKAALVAQDGLDRASLEWDAFDGLFVGGSTAFKMAHSTTELADEARRRGKWVHVGRVNSEGRMRAWAAHADSCDGTFLAFGPDVNLVRLLGWLSRPTLWENV